MNDLLLQCVRIGISIDEYWDLDFGEIQLLFDAYSANKKSEMKERAGMLWKLSVMTAANVGASLSGKKPPSLYDYFPELFAQEKEEEELMNFQNQFLQYTKLYNAQHTGGTERGE